MPIRITCPHCDQELRLPEQLYEQPAQCPLCDGAFSIRWRRRRPTEPARNETALPADDGERSPCPFCNKPIRPEAVKCPHCRRWFRDYG